MEDALVLECATVILGLPGLVLILVLMEDALVHNTCNTSLSDLPS